LLKALQIKKLADGTYDTSRSRVEFRAFWMDSKRHRDEKSKQRAASKAKKIIDTWRPDVVITSDDNAAKYLLAPYYRNAVLPFVYCGINRDAGVYGLPFSNTTGMVEVKPVRETLEVLRQYAHGDRLGYIGSHNLSNERNVEDFQKTLGRSFDDGALVESLAEWRKAYLRLQKTVDMLLWLTPDGMRGWDSEEAERFVMTNARIPSGGTSDHHMRYSLLGQVNIAEEQGWWAGNTALRILAGTAPSAIPPVVNKDTRLYLNMKMAKRLKIKFPIDLIEKATFVMENGVGGAK